jgi:hypothetical protein
MLFLWNILKDELTNAKILKHKESEYNQKRENVYFFLRLPWALEKVIHNNKHNKTKQNYYFINYLLL